MSNEVDDVLYRFLIDQERAEVLMVSLISQMITLKRTIELNIPSKFDLDILRYLGTLVYPEEYQIVMTDISEIIKLKTEILELYANRKH